MAGRDGRAAAPHDEQHRAGAGTMGASNGGACGFSAGGLQGAGAGARGMAACHPGVVRERTGRGREAAHNLRRSLPFRRPRVAAARFSDHIDLCFVPKTTRGREKPWGYAGLAD